MHRNLDSTSVVQSKAMQLRRQASLSHFSQLFSCCYIITGQETGHWVTIQLINQVIDRHLSHKKDCSMCCQRRIDIHSNPCWLYLAQASNAVSFCFPPSSGGENNSMWRGISFLIAFVWSISPCDEGAERQRRSFNICGSYAVLTKRRWTVGIHWCMSVWTWTPALSTQSLMSILLFIS